MNPFNSGKKKEKTRSKVKKATLQESNNKAFLQSNHRDTQ